MTTDTLSQLADLIAAAQKAGADAADALLVESASVSIGRRLNQPEKLERAESIDLGLRVFVGQRQAVISSTDRRPAALQALVERVMAMARAVPEDPYAGLAAPEDLAIDRLELDLCDPVEPDVETLIARAQEAEAAAMEVAGISNSDGAEAGWGRSTITLVASNGFAERYQRSRHSLSVSVIAGAGDTMQRDYDYSSTIHAGDLASPAQIGRLAGERTVKRLNPRKIASTQVPLVFDPRVSASFLSSLAGAIAGTSIARGSSFLKDSLGKPVFAPGITIYDHPFIPRGLRSRPFDGEGIAPLKRPLVNQGFLTSWIMDLSSARQLGLVSTGHAARGTGGPPSPSPTNLYLMPGQQGPAEMLSEVGTGLYVTEMMGGGGSIITGDYSRGAAGFWIENGELAYPVSEITIAGNLKDMFLHLTPANDLVHRYGIDAPTVRIDGMTVAGR
jgi:PmbA protein